MPKPVITVENLSKAYRIGLKEEVPDTLMSAMTGFMKAPLKKFHELRKLDTFRHSGDSEDIYWALKDVSFEVQEGEVLGVIGRNGAGKSTLLKILSRITEPTSGRAVIRGRVSSLLEVGTGFHPELSGRENVYLNGTILGMTKREIDSKFDEIVDFSGVEKFLDTPIKRYSSGMKVRLAFAVAAHLEPEILIIDEVLAVGDAEFQKKCMGKMQDVARGGRTVLFVSHNMAAVESLCDRAILLDQGKLIRDDDVHTIVSQYSRIDCHRKVDVASLPRISSAYGNVIRIIDVTIGYQHHRADFAYDDELLFEIALRMGTVSGVALRVGITIHAGWEAPIFSTFVPITGATIADQVQNVHLGLSDHRLAPGSYTISVSVGTGDISSARYEFDVVKHAASFEVGGYSTKQSQALSWHANYGHIVYREGLSSAVLV